MGLVAPVDSDEVGGECLDLACIAEPPGVDATRTRDRRNELTHHRYGLAVLSQYQHVIVKVVDRWIIEQNGADVMKSGDHRGVGEQLLRFLRCRAGCHSQRKWPLLVEAERVDAVDDDLAGQLCG